MITVTQAQPQDLDEITQLHERVFVGFFLTSLGNAFLKELYRGFATHPSGVVLVARDGAELVGFVVGTTDPACFFAALRRRRGAALLLKSLPAILKNPRPVVIKLISGLFYKGNRPQPQMSGTLLSSIGVEEKYRGTPLPSLLLRNFEREAAKLGSFHVYLTTDADRNCRVNAFYKKNGYKIERVFKQNGDRLMNCYIKNVEQTNNAFD